MSDEYVWRDGTSKDGRVFEWVQCSHCDHWVHDACRLGEQSWWHSICQNFQARADRLRSAMRPSHNDHEDGLVAMATEALLDMALERE